MGAEGCGRLSDTGPGFSKKPHTKRCGEGPPKGRRQEGFDAVPLALVFRLPLVDDDVAVSRPMRDGARARPRGACLGEKPVAEMATEIRLSVSYGRLYCA